MTVEWMWEAVTGRDDLRAYVARRLVQGAPVSLVAEEVRARTGAAVTAASIRALAAQ
jgi:hypothetical protein